MKINESSIDSIIRIFSGVLLLYLGFGGELFGVLAIVADMLGVLVWTVKPTLEKLAQEYNGQVDLWEINADENRELLRQLKVYGIPTLIGYHKDEEKVRYIGAKPRSQLKSLFEALATGAVPASNELSNWDRLVRVVTGSLVAGVGWTSHHSWTLLVIGGILMFSAVYDRCPIWKAITTQFKKVMAK